MNLHIGELCLSESIVFLVIERCDLGDDAVARGGIACGGGCRVAGDIGFGARLYRDEYDRDGECGRHAVGDAGSGDERCAPY